MADVDNVFTDLFDALLDTDYDGLMIYGGRIPNFWKAKWKGFAPGFDAIENDEIRYDLESLGITVSQMEGKGFFLWKYEREGKRPVVLRMKHTQWGENLRLVVYRPGASISDTL